MYACSVVGCESSTVTHYCESHKRWCSECGAEWSDVELVAGKCFECHRIDNAYDGCSCAYCVEVA